MDTEHSLTQIHETFFIVIEIPNENKLTKRGNYFSNAKKTLLTARSFFHQMTPQWASFRDLYGIPSSSKTVFLTLVIFSTLVQSWEVEGSPKTLKKQAFELALGVKESKAWLEYESILCFDSLQSISDECSFTLSLKCSPIF